MSYFYHFAYGANMNYSELKKYIKKNIKVIGVGYLDNYTFKYRNIKNRKITAKASIEKKKMNVFTVLFSKYMVLWKTYIKKKNLIMLILKKLNYYILLYQQKKRI